VTGIYLDYAATSAIRPDEVTRAVTDYLTRTGATPGRAGHARALDAGRIALRCRKAMAELFSIEGDPGRICFQPNATYALNAAILGLLRPGDAVVRTQYDHNAVRRPIAALTASGVEERVLAGDAAGRVDLDELDLLLRGRGRQAKLLVLPHVSNVLGTALPVAEMTARAHEVGALVLLDAAQSAGHLPVSVRDLGVDMLAFTGHKGLLGPQGIGGLWLRDGADLPPLVHGGTGGDSAPATMPMEYPDRLEAGTLNGPGIAGLLAGIEWIAARGVHTIHEREAALRDRLRAKLGRIPGVRVLSPGGPGTIGIVTITTDRHTPAALAAELERRAGVATRAGLHCAPGAHEAIGTLATGALRFSVGWATTDDDVDCAAAALAAICHNGYNGERAE
jgi:cysteine desulfurase family protein